MSLTFTLVLTVESAGSAPTDVLVRGTSDQTVGELARRLCAYLGVPASDALLVERTGEHLRPDAPLSSVDLLEGDLVTVLPPRRR